MPTFRGKHTKKKKKKKYQVQPKSIKLCVSTFNSEKAMATHSSTLAWKTPWTEEPGRLQSMGSLELGHDWATSLSLFTFTFHFHALEKEMATHSSVLAWSIPGTGEPGGLPSMGSHRVGHDWTVLAAAESLIINTFLFCPLVFELVKFPSLEEITI